MTPRKRSVALVHDYLTQRGGAERVVLAMHRAFPDAPLYTSLYDPEGAYPEFVDVDVRPSFLNRVGSLRRSHRRALPVLAPTFTSLRVDADVVICSSSGWAHGVRTRGRKIVYCHAPARWLYQSDRYLATATTPARAAFEALRPLLTRWDQRAARTADRYLANSTYTRDQVNRVYGIDAEILFPPPGIDTNGPWDAVAGVEPGYFLSVSRLLPYKHVDAVVAAFGYLRDERLVVVGSGPEDPRVRQTMSANVLQLADVDDAQLRWLYANAQGVIAASYEDFGLVPLEAAAFGKPTAALAYGGYLETVMPGVTGVFFDAVEPMSIAGAVRRLVATPFDPMAARLRAREFAEARFRERLSEIVDCSDAVPRTR
jgi:glycosyltransferase involved in cell wall biosynthesis